MVIGMLMEQIPICKSDMEKKMMGRETKAMGLRRFCIVGLAILSLCCAAPVMAGPIGPITVGPGNSWVVSWLDTTNTKSYDMTEFFITGSSYTFDAAAQNSQSGWTGSLVNSTYTYVSGPSASANKYLTLFFGGSLPLGGVQVDVLVWNEGSLVSGESWRYTDLPNGLYSSWEYITSPNPSNTVYNRVYHPVPEGGSIVLLLGIGIAGVASLRRLWM